MRIDLKAIADDLVRTVRGYVAASVHPISERLAVLETKYALAPPKGEKGDPGPAGEKGHDGIQGAPGKKGEKGDPGATGDRGEKGQDADPAPLRAEILQALFEAVDALPVAKDGERGTDGERGPAGPQGEKGEAGEKGLDADPVDLEALALKAAALIPKPKDGRDGKDAPAVDLADLAQHAAGLIPAPKPGKDGEKGEKGDRGEPGRDGRDASDLDMIGKMIAEQIGRQFEQLLGSLKVDSTDGGRTLVFEMLGVKHEVKTAHVIDRDVWKDGAPYDRGDGVTWAGSWWIAQVDAPTERPGTGSQWRLAVKRGREGKEGKQGPPGPRGERGDRVP